MAKEPMQSDGRDEPMEEGGRINEGIPDNTPENKEPAQGPRTEDRDRGDVRSEGTRKP